MHGDDSLLRDFLIDAGLVPRSQLIALPESEQSLAEALVSQGILGEDEVRRAVAHALGVPFVMLSPHDINTDAMILIPEPLSREHQIIGYKTTDNALEVALLDLGTLDRLGDIKRQHRILPRLTTRESMRQALLHYQKHLKEKFGEMLTNGEHLAEALIKHALYSRAGGVHVDPHTMGTLIRYQIGHTLHEAVKLPEQVGKQLVSQLKSFAKLLPVSRPQDGKFKIEKDGHTINVRVQSVPTINGDRLRVRLAREQNKGYTLEALGFHGESLEALERTMARHEGLLVVRGLGKTTLLHTLVDLLEAPHRTLVWVHDAVALRAALRHDPDVIIVDDVKDTQTAVLARAAAARGIFVIVATNTDELVGNTTVTLAKVRRLCTKQFAHTAKFSRKESEGFEPYADFVKVLTALKDEMVLKPDLPWKDAQFAHPSPCSECHSGYQGDIGLAQVEERGVVVGLNIVEDGLFKSAQGLTSTEEVLSLL
jgi:type IV pilus assembly protein PilB